MNRRDFLGGLAIGLAAGSHAWAQDADTAATGAAASFHDLMPDFWRVYDAGRGIKDPQQRAHALNLGYVAPHADLYAAQPIDQDARPGLIDDARIATWLKSFDPLAASVRAMSQALPLAWAAHDRRFGQAFSDVDRSTPVYAMTSFGQFQADARLWNGRATLVIGPDAIVQQQGDHTNLAVLFDQAAFRLYQRQVNPALLDAGGVALWSRLWREGLAEYVSQQLVPGAAQGDLIMDDGRLAIFTPASVAAELIGELDSTSPLDSARFFASDYQGDIPPRTGYLLGLLVLQRVGRGYSLPQLARMSAAQARALVQTGLGQIANG